MSAAPLVAVPPVERTVDLHTHSDLTDGTASPEAMADAAVAAGLTRWALSDHVRADSTWVDGYATRVRALHRDGLVVQCAVEAKVLDAAGRLDLPDQLPVLDHVLVADHQFPGADGPVHPATVRAALEDGRWLPPDVVTTLVTATAAALHRAPFRPVVAHLFSLLPKLGLSEDDVTDEHRDVLALACLATGAAVEVNQKWACPSARTLRHLAAAGVELTAGSDAHRPADVGVHTYLDHVTAAGPADVAAPVTDVAAAPR